MNTNRPQNTIFKYSGTLLQVSIGIIYIWFGILKFFPSQSPAQLIAKETIGILTLGFFSDNISIFILAVTETVVGLLLILNIFRREVVWIALAHIFMTFSPILFLTDQVFVAPMVPTLLGQYIIKNLVIFSTLLLLTQRICHDHSCTKVC